MNKKQVGQRVKLARVFYEQRTGNKMTQEIPICWGFFALCDKKISPRFLGGLRRKEVLSFVTVCYFFI